MSFLDRVDVLILTWNEEANLARTLSAVARFPRVVILDSGSADATLEIAARFSNVRVCTHPFDSHAAQWNYGLRNCGLNAEWVVALDADYVLTPSLVEELTALAPLEGVNGFRANFRYCIDGTPLSGSLYPPVTFLYRRARAEYIQDGHTQRVVVAGSVARIEGQILHDDRKALSQWLTAQDRYARLECKLLLSRPWRRLGWGDRLRRMTCITPWLVPMYCLTVGRGFLDGRRGLFYAMQRGIAEAILSIHLLQAKFSRRPPK